MDTTPQHTEYRPSNQPIRKNQVKDDKHHFRRHSQDFSILLQDLGQNIQIHHFDFCRNSQDVVQIFTRGTEEEEDSVIPENQRQDRDITQRKEEIRKAPQRNPQKEKEKVKEDENLIEDPTSELDDPYKRGHSDRKKSPPIDEDAPDPKKNTNTKG
jgi:hypothetical protein